jgi:hypothetical protein
MKCVRDNLTGLCARHHDATTVVFVPVDGRRVFLTCLLLIVLCVVWLAMWLYRGVKFEEE